MRLHGKWLVPLAAFLLLLGACADGEETTDVGTGTETPATDTDTETDTGTEATGTEPAGETFTVALAELNDSGVSGEVTLTVDGDELTVEIEASGLEADQTHPQHIHGPEDGAATCPGPDADEDGDGTITVQEGAPAYGPVILGLEPFPNVGSDGEVSFSETFELSGELDPLTDRVVVLHGLTVDGEYDASLPVACGEITEA